MRLGILIAIASFIIIFSVYSILIYNNWQHNKYDNFVIEKSEKYGLPSTLVKALIKVESQFRYTATRPNGDKGLMMIPERVVDEYLKAHNINRLGYVCLNRYFKNHASVRNKRYDKAGRCEVCLSRLIEEIYDPETNIEIGCWYLAKLRDDINEILGGTSRITIPFLVMLYRIGYDPLKITYTDFLNRFVIDTKNFTQLPLNLPEPERENLQHYAQSVLLQYKRYEKRRLK